LICFNLIEIQNSKYYLLFQGFLCFSCFKILNLIIYLYLNKNTIKIILLVFKNFFIFFIQNQQIFIFAKNFIFVILSLAFSMTSICLKDFHLYLIVFYHSTNYFTYFCFSPLYNLLKSLMVKIIHSVIFRYNHYHIKSTFAFENY